MVFVQATRSERSLIPVHQALFCFRLEEGSKGVSNRELICASDGENVVDWCTSGTGFAYDGFNC